MICYAVMLFFVAVRPHLNPHEFSETKQKVEKFEKNEGGKLQKILAERAKSRKNWVGITAFSYNTAV